jgi:hypothetical protein
MHILGEYHKLGRKLLSQYPVQLIFHDHFSAPYCTFRTTEDIAKKTLNEQEILERTNRQLSLDTTRTS